MQAKRGLCIRASLRKWASIAVVPLMTVTFCVSISLSGKPNQYRQILIPEALIGRQHLLKVTYTLRCRLRAERNIQATEINALTVKLQTFDIFKMVTFESVKLLSKGIWGDFHWFHLLYIVPFKGIHSFECEKRKSTSLNNTVVDWSMRYLNLENRPSLITPCLLCPLDFMTFFDP